MEILTVESARWKEFEDRLDQLMARNVCESNHCLTVMVLTLMGGIDIDGTLEYFNDHGGYCDCEVLSNVEQNAEARRGYAN